MTPDDFKAHRKALGKTQAELGYALGYGSGQMISEIECGRRNPSGTAVLLLNAYLNGAPIPKAPPKKASWRRVGEVLASMNETASVEK